MCWLCLGPSSCKPSRKHNFYLAQLRAPCQTGNFISSPKTLMNAILGISEWRQSHTGAQETAGLPTYPCSWNKEFRMGTDPSCEICWAGKAPGTIGIPQWWLPPSANQLVLIAGCSVCARGLLHPSALRKGS